MKRFAIILGIVVLVLVGGGLLGFRLAVQMLKGKVVAALGAGGAVKELNVGWSTVELVGLDVGEDLSCVFERLLERFGRHGAPPVLG